MLRGALQNAGKTLDENDPPQHFVQMQMLTRRVSHIGSVLVVGAPVASQEHAPFG